MLKENGHLKLKRIKIHRILFSSSILSKPNLLVSFTKQKEKKSRIKKREKNLK